MPITTITTPAPNYRLTTLNTVKDELNIEGHSENARLDRLIDRASDKLRSMTNRVFRQERVTETVRGYGNTKLTLERTPVWKVESVAFQGEPITDYEIGDAEAGFLYRRTGWVWTTSFDWEIERINVPNSEAPLFTVDYWAGYLLPDYDSSYTPPTEGEDKNLPKDVEEFCIELIKQRYFARGQDPTIQQEKIGDYQYSKGSPITSAFLDEQAKFIEKWGRVV